MQRTFAASRGAWYVHYRNCAFRRHLSVFYARRNPHGSDGFGWARASVCPTRRKGTHNADLTRILLPAARLRDRGRSIQCLVFISKKFAIRSHRSPVFDELEHAWNDIRQRAFQLFQQRGGAGGSEVDGCCRQRGLLWRPQAELIEDESQFRLQLAVPGIQPGNLRVTALPQSIIVRAESAITTTRKKAKCTSANSMNAACCENSTSMCQSTWSAYLPI